MKNAAEKGEKGRDKWETGGVHMLCGSGSASTGDGTKRIAYRWRLQTETGLVLQLMQQPIAHRTLPNGVVRFGSVPLMRFGTSGRYRQACHWLSAIGADVEWNKLGRTDPCVDRAGVPVATFCDPLPPR
jgi:hypothetical protein